MSAKSRAAAVSVASNSTLLVLKLGVGRLLDERPPERRLAPAGR